jgi:hypothetical protein
MVDIFAYDREVTRGVDQPGLPEAMGAIKMTLPRSTRYTLCSERLIITLVS